jgi:hypothetical protein
MAHDRQIKHFFVALRYGRNNSATEVLSTFKCREKNLDWFALDVERGLFELHFVLMFRFKFA